MNEHSYIRSVHRHLPPEILTWKILDPYQGGVPDAFYAGPAGQLWVEYKFTKLPVRDSSKVAVCLSEQQKLWLSRLRKNNIPCAVILGTLEGGVVLDLSESYGMLTKGDIADRLQDQKSIATFIKAQVT